ncbi:hypothetical protein JMJ77_0000906 [Colletotrichum scovillei]|uniref:Uncharacterized protein n=1 Tax=Colletotrichum scovillei TaxID=1209932 RepID=A0A9P7RAJ5_9PEZI|nr:hypothetical protein JMJ77_0000906 [Colletotrichum scovillei]KAG7072120.1 hypothetical protein JMJ76_0004980 [Colletotrichum scovillei]KAG7080435.1 hypothetical protein JMJ78_0007529 [Colletotrichum scovillei]
MADGILRKIALGILRSDSSRKSSRGRSDFLRPSTNAAVKLALSVSDSMTLSDEIVLSFDLSRPWLLKWATRRDLLRRFMGEVMLSDLVSLFSFWTACSMFGPVNLSKAAKGFLSPLIARRYFSSSRAAERPSLTSRLGAFSGDGK